MSDTHASPPKTADRRLFIPPELWLEIFTHLGYHTLKYVIPSVSEWLSALLRPHSSNLPTTVDLILFRDRLQPAPANPTDDFGYSPHPALGRRFQKTTPNSVNGVYPVHQVWLEQCFFDADSDSTDSRYLGNETATAALEEIRTWMTVDPSALSENAVAPAVTSVWINAYEITSSAPEVPLTVRDMLRGEVKLSIQLLKNQHEIRRSESAQARWRAEHLSERLADHFNWVGAELPRARRLAFLFGLDPKIAGGPSAKDIITRLEDMAENDNKKAKLFGSLRDTIAGHISEFEDLRDEI